MKVFIACAAQENIDKKYIELAHNVSNHLAKEGYDLVFGAWSKSMMGECYNTFLKNNRKVTSCVPKIYIDDLKGLEESEHIIYEDTITRFKGLYDLSDLIVVLPGGVGTISELLASIEEAKNDVTNNKRVILYNYDGYFDGIIEWYNNKKELGFISRDLNSIISIVNTEEEFYKIVGGLK